MPRLFTVTHRAKYRRNVGEPNFHGLMCEAVYLDGMLLLNSVNKLRKAIRVVRWYNNRPTITQETDKKYFRRMMLEYRSLPEGFSLPEMQKQFKTDSAKLKEVREKYTFWHTLRHKRDK